MMSTLLLILGKNVEFDDWLAKLDLGLNKLERDTSVGLFLIWVWSLYYFDSIALGAWL